MTLKKISAVLLYCLLAFAVFAQVKPYAYDQSWKRIDSLINKKRLTQSALQEVNKLYDAAKKESNDAQVIKALLYRMTLQSNVLENAVEKNISGLEQEIKTTKEPAASILTSILAEAYWNYLQQHRYKLYDRTATVNFKKDDIATWGLADFNKKISELYLSSLKDEQKLQQTSLSPFDAIIVKGNVRYLRPTLFDLLAHRALDYFKNDERDVSKPAYAFEISDPQVFAAAGDFMNIRFSTPDSLSLHFKALLLFQQLLRLHNGDTKPDALLDVDIERLAFVNQHSTIDNTETLYQQALQVITNKYATIPAAAQAWYQQAIQYTAKAEKYDALKDTSNRYAYLHAIAICEKVSQEKDSSEGKTNCINLLRTIRRKDLKLEAEKVNIPDQPFRVLVNYRNFSQLYLRVIKINRAGKQSLGENTWQDDYWKKLLQLPALKSFSQKLPETNDYQDHAVEIKVDALPSGEYALVSSLNSDFSLTKNQLALQYFYVSNISYINNGADYFILNRETGQPLKYATAQVWNRYYDYKLAKYSITKAEEYQANPNGYFLLRQPKNAKRDGQLLEITTANDHLFLDDNADIVSVGYNSEDADENDFSDKVAYEKNNLKSFLFTDRSIYRPGQTVFFKGIVVTKDFSTKQSKILSGFKTKVILYNANEEKVDSMQLVTNEFGSYCGKFTLPEGVLNGDFKITDDSTGSDQSFSMEEYKRPKFYLDYEKLKGAYRLNDTIKITGSAKAYAGNTIAGAMVKYRVIRLTRFPYPWLSTKWRIPLDQNNEMEITHGETKTNAEGKFMIHFSAVPDKSVKNEADPVFDFNIIADVTDINGETRSAATTVTAGYKALNISVVAPIEENLLADSLKNIIVETSNLSGEFEPAKFNLAIYALKFPARLIRLRYWKQPDQFIMTKEDYLKNFPFDEYKDESNKENWEKDAKVFETTDSTKIGARIKLGGTRFEPGWYVIEVTANDTYGQQIKNIKYIQLYNSKTGTPVSPQYKWAFSENETAEPGEKATVNVGSSAQDVFVIQYLDKPGAVPANPGSSYNFLTVNGEKKSISFEITEKDFGGFGINYAFIKNNRFFFSTHVVNVPWNSKELNIGYETYRKKTLPGSAEKWKIKISGTKKDKIIAEVLGGMYDASLDQFKTHYWSKPDIWNSYSAANNWSSRSCFSRIKSQNNYLPDDEIVSFSKVYDVINIPINNNTYTNQGNMYVYGNKMNSRPAEAAQRLSATPTQEMNVLFKNAPQAKVSSFIVQDVKLKDVREYPEQAMVIDPSATQIRKNFNETAFFFPDLKTDSSGNVEFSFTMPEALTQWKWMTLAHTKDLAFGYAEKSIITQKQLMVQPNIPRFLREGDHLELTTKIVNLSDSEMTGQVELQLIDATTNQPVDGWFQNMQANQYFTVAAKQSEPVSFPLQIPYQYNKPLTYRITAHTAGRKGGNDGVMISDGEEATLPVLSNRMLVTESVPLPMNGIGTKNFTFEKLLKSGESETLNNHSLTLEFTSNPAWYAVQALPYLMEYPYECAEQTFNRYYANALASKIAGSSPRIKEVFQKWLTSDTSALLSNLQKNQELKSVLLEETPWVLQAKTESEQKKNIALLFNMVRMDKEATSALAKLQDMQSPDGGFSWFKGGPGDRYITQYILTGIGHLKKLNALSTSANDKIDAIVKAAIPYLDKQVSTDYRNMQRTTKKAPIHGGLGYTQIQYLYMRSFFSGYAIPGEVFNAVNYFRKESQQDWLTQSKFMQGMIALSLYRTGDIQKAKDILASLKQNAIINDELGMYWKDVSNGYYWYQSPVETQSLLVEAFQEISKDPKIIGALKIWLLKQKQTQSWKTTKATADACYALLLQGTDWITATPSVQISMGGKPILETSVANSEAGTGYVKKVIDGPFVNAAMGNITVSVATAAEKNISPSWGAVYWQYFENLDKITMASTPLQLSKKIFVEKNTDRGPVLEPVGENGVLKIGDKVKVRIELRVDRDMEYVHMKDMRAACMEPVNVLSGYQWQGSLGYYESTKDASTNFFFSWLPKGIYVFEYPLFVTTAGDFGNGITNIECMYAPEFSAHSEGLRVSIEP